jgi:hypothetical protein
MRANVPLLPKQRRRTMGPKTAAPLQCWLLLRDEVNFVASQNAKKVFEPLGAPLTHRCG